MHKSLLIQRTRLLILISAIFLLFVVIFFLTSCEFSPSLPIITPTHFPDVTDTPSPTIPPTPGKFDWHSIQPGLERRTLNLTIDDKYLDSLYILRLEPVYFQFDLAFDPQGRTLEAWQAQTEALIVLNGGYFSLENETYLPNGLTVIDGIPMGSSYGDFGGMLAVTEIGPELRWLAQQPYDPTEPLLAALQSFPILIKPGRELGFPEEYEDNLIARRTVIAQDRKGRILLIVAPQGNLTLHQLSVYLTDSDLELDIALNLDGGPSSGIILSEPVETIPALSPLPVVITVHRR
jgi:hypothetical protein